MQNVIVNKTKGKKRVGAAAMPAQHRFLTELVTERRPVAIFLVNGLKLEGTIVSFDDYAILLEGELSDHVYKHAISTIQPLTKFAARKERTAKGPMMRATPSTREAPQYAAVDAVERKPRQPTIVVRPRRRIVKATADDS
ncbi:MAG: RNA chaperone Hfq [Burkholderiales bacterium]